MSMDGAEKKGSSLFTYHTVGGEVIKLEWRFDFNFKLNVEGGGYFIEDDDGDRFFPDEHDMKRRLMLRKCPLFKVLYVGQSYGKGGSRNVIDRLKRHETLQKIALKSPGDTSQGLHILALEVLEANRSLTLFNPHAEDDSTSLKRIKSGNRKLFETKKKEKVTLHEAALIRYFQPEFNKEFKDSFPSTNMKVLKDCYEKDLSAIIAEICIDEIDFKIYSDTVEPSYTHMIEFDFHKEDCRKVFSSFK